MILIFFFSLLNTRYTSVVGKKKKIKNFRISYLNPINREIKST